MPSQGHAFYGGRARALGGTARTVLQRCCLSWPLRGDDLLVSVANRRLVRRGRPGRTAGQRRREADSQRSVRSYTVP
jgi:hypothetical protein